ncbi:hypothetical protein K2173_027654 [Erythroxylum novogranatense]|uniref:Uncharacterized protein n=1 Tax=Erythroxylum novogranatense TaxID=1862640 RepID=A0AAV8TZK8_9ROSI|nr:hypothetical protein K2173_027654 [Erythroxylum novogranatense]
MSMTPPLLKKPKPEPNDGGGGDGHEPTDKPKSVPKDDTKGGGQTEDDDGEVPEEAVVALIEHRTREVEHLRRRIAYYKSQLVEAEKKLSDSQLQLARIRTRNKGVPSSTSIRVENASNSPIRVSDGPKRNQPQSRTELVIPSVEPKYSNPVKSFGSPAKVPVGSNSHPSPSTHPRTFAKVKLENDGRNSSDVEVFEVQDRGRKRNLEEQEHKELIPLVCSSSSPCTIRCHASNHIASQHKRKLRSIALCPTNYELFVTSSLDGMVNLWQIQCRGSSASMISSTDCMSQKHRWPEDIAWHPLGHSLFSVYTADGGDSQISVLNLNKAQGRARVTFLDKKPHVKGIINSIIFLPWENSSFVTGGSDHAVVLWNETDGENSWNPRVLHRDQHSSAVMGVAGMHQKQVILSAGSDKRIIGFDAHARKANFKHQLDSKCMSVLPNPCDQNLFMVQTGTQMKQLRLFDFRLRRTEIHAFGFKQESSDSQSALINQAWSPDGLYISSGSVDPVIHIFDIRYNSQKPSQSIRAHQKRVFKAVWHSSLPLLISISSDLHVGLHKI